MISRVLIKDDILLSDIELSLNAGLSVITGVSGAGKSVFMRNLLSVFGLGVPSAGVVETDIDGVSFEKFSEFGISCEEVNTFKLLKDKNTRYFINNQMISKKNLIEISKSYILHLNTSSQDEFGEILELLDESIKDKSHKSNLKSMQDEFLRFCELNKEIEKIKDEESRVAELREFTKFEIDKIEKISPKIGEFEELMELKKRLSKKDKIESAWQVASTVFECETAVVEALRVSDMDSSFFEDAMNELRVRQEGLNLDELDEIDAEKILDRIEALNSLVMRYGGIKECLDELANKKAELQRYENLSFEKDHLIKEKNALEKELLSLSTTINKSRKFALKPLENLLNSYTKKLYMSEISLVLLETQLNKNGTDELILRVNNTEIKSLSSGELNRLRLAYLATRASVTGQGMGVILIDEIDSNLSGKEAMSIANVLSEISKYYQIFAISHQPQLSSKAKTHYLVQKFDGKSTIKTLSKDEKIKELARMISGEVITEEATMFAKKLLEN